MHGRTRERFDLRRFTADLSLAQTGRLGLGRPLHIAENQMQPRSVATRRHHLL